MDEKFLEQRLRLIRDLADKADPFIKKTADGLGEQLRGQA
jgi:hypothetical protein